MFCLNCFSTTANTNGMRLAPLFVHQEHLFICLLILTYMRFVVASQLASRGGGVRIHKERQPEIFDGHCGSAVYIKLRILSPIPRGKWSIRRPPGFDSIKPFQR
ncbi:hypothetical protein K440DRAFT_315798 [Wilcoxina mikolae CBS 423.85]|nr:hypothetical protein K440DRAFT_315798 [Wilcoxina mikolae CBS 423.85]